MDSKTLDYISNPLTCRLLVQIDKRGQATAKELAAICPDIPQTSLYRYLSRMLSDGALKVVQERRVRGMIERVFAVNVALEIEEKDLAGDDVAARYFSLFTRFSLGLVREFLEYTEQDGIDVANDGSGFWLTPLCLDDAELDDLATQMQALVNQHLAKEPREGRKWRNVAVVVTPPSGSETDSTDVEGFGK